MAAQALGSQSHIVAAAFSSLRELRLFECTMDGTTFIDSLLLCSQLQKLELSRCQLTPAAITALPALQQLQQLRELVWSEPEHRQDTHHPSADAAATLAQLAHLTQLTHITLGSDQASASSRIATVTGMTNLASFTMGSTGFTLPKIKWKVLSSGHLSQLLTSCPLLTTLSMEEVVLDQAGLDLLLAHPHIVNVALLSIAATESRVDSPCSWQTLRLANEFDIRTVAYAPLHSLKEPLSCGALLLPPDVPSDQLPQLLLKATTRIAEHTHLFSSPAYSFVLCDFVTQLASYRCAQWFVAVQRAFSPTAQSALLDALEKLAAIWNPKELLFRFCCRASRLPRLSIGKPDLEALHRTWGSRITHLGFQGVSLSPGFFPALETCLPKLETVGLENAQPGGQELVPRIMLFCQRMTRPMRLILDPDVLE
jgi:hypothetical protein